MRKFRSAGGRLLTKIQKQLSQYNTGVQNWLSQLSTVYVYSYLTPEADGDADAHADTDHAGHCQEQPHLEILRDITLGQKLL